MTMPNLQDLAGVTREMQTIYEQAFQKPNPELHRLYEMAKRDQWNVADLDWSKADMSQVPQEMRQGLANLFSQTHYGELGALMSTAKAVELAPDMMAKMFGGTQVMDEARHVEWFTKLIQKLDCRGQILPTVEQLMSEVFASDTAEQLLVGMQIIIEGVAQTLFIEGGRMVREIDVTAPGMESLAGIHTVVGDWMVNYVGKDESRHVAFGVLFVNERVKQMTPRQVTVLNEKAERWGNLIMESVQQRVRDFAMFGFDHEWLAKKCLADQNERLRKAGLEARAREAA
jgi:hypothetical protein